MRGGGPSSIGYLPPKRVLGSRKFHSVVAALNPVGEGTFLGDALRYRQQIIADNKWKRLSEIDNEVEKKRVAIHNSLAPLLTKLEQEEKNVEKLQKTIVSLDTVRPSSGRPSSRRENRLNAKLDELKTRSANVGRLDSEVNNTLTSIILAEKADNEKVLQNKGRVGTERSRQSTNLQIALRDGKFDLKGVGLKTTGGVKRRVYKGVKKPVKRPAKRPVRK